MTHPGCFGVPSVFSFTSSVCKACASNAACQERSHAALLAAPVTVVSRLLEKHNQYRREKELSAPESLTLNLTLPVPKDKSGLAVRVPLTDSQERVVGRLPKKAGDYLRKLMVRGTDKKVLDAAHRGENAFTQDKHRPYHLALEKLLHGGITKPGLRIAYCTELGWSENAAFSQVSIIWNLFPAMGLANAQGCALVAHPRVKTQNDSIRERGNA